MYCVNKHIALNTSMPQKRSENCMETDTARTNNTFDGIFVIERN